MTSNCFVPKQESVYGCQLGKQACLSAIFWYCNIMIANGTNITIARCRVFGMENIKGLPTIFFGNFKKKDNNITCCSIFTIFNFYYTKQIINHYDR